MQTLHAELVDRSRAAGNSAILRLSTRTEPGATTRKHTFATKNTLNLVHIAPESKEHVRSQRVVFWHVSNAPSATEK